MKLSYDKVIVTERYDKWHGRLDNTIRGRIARRIMRFNEGNLGNTKRLGDNLFEVKGEDSYRVYFGLVEKCLVLLGGGTKSSQQIDIERESEYWK